jgi:hypothetical protein
VWIYDGGDGAETSRVLGLPSASAQRSALDRAARAVSSWPGWSCDPSSGASLEITCSQRWGDGQWSMVDVRSGDAPLSLVVTVDWHDRAV